MKFNALFLFLLSIFYVTATPLFSKPRKKKKSITTAQPNSTATTESPEHSHTLESSSLFEDQTSSVKKIRVLLAEHDADQATKFLIKSSQGFILESPVENGQTAVYNKPEIHLKCENKTLYLQCRDGKYRRVKYPTMEVCTTDKHLVLNGTAYQGSFIFRIEEATGKLLVINKLPLEDYVSSVVAGESIPTWPFGMQKIQAIISRTYALYLMQQARIKNPLFKHFDLKNTNLHQVYNGAHGYKHLRQAVDETENLVVTHQGKIALTMFDGCCAGFNPSLGHPKDASKPYLARSERCFFCEQSPLYQWKTDVHETTFLKELKANPVIGDKFKKFGTQLASIAMNIDKAGLIIKVKFYDQHNHHVNITGNDMRKAFPNRIKSLSFTIKKINDRVVIAGKGLGHQRGLCQWGAKELICRGWSIKSILQFYYPGVTISRLS